MAIIAQRPLFGWQEIEPIGDLGRLHLVLSNLPDEELVATLEAERGLRGRDDYPVRAMWNATVAGVVFQHPTVAALLRELARNGQLRQECGFWSDGGAALVAPPWVFSRFLLSASLAANLGAKSLTVGEIPNARRSAVERVNSRLDNVFGFENHTIRGLLKMRTRCTLALVVMLAMALGRIRANQSENMRSLLARAG